MANKWIAFFSQTGAEIADISESLGRWPDLIITNKRPDHLRIMPKPICEKYLVYNGHPGLITKYPELKGKDPQVRAFEGKYPVAGAVIHKVVAGVDEGRVIMEEKFNAMNLSLDELFRILRDRSLFMWTNFLKKVL